MTTIEFFHDAVCGWCYLLSPRLRQLSEKYNVKVIHRAFVLQKSEDEMIVRFGSMAQAKQEILNHWRHCQLNAEDPNRIDIEGMRNANFNYPSGLNAALAAKTAEIFGGHIGHWDYFDAVQTAHLKHNLNISDTSVLLNIAERLGYFREQFIDVMMHQDTLSLVNSDNKRAKTLGIKTIPSILIDNESLVSQTLTLTQLEALFKKLNIEKVSN
ncbi:DsbA family oxidoreductase [Planctobacterium marinum]|uniref:DsbA family oxidoreductase n=2 Tax=Planctobacterium marinum TaxID=1631968 RepID=UPI00361E8EB1